MNSVIIVAVFFNNLILKQMNYEAKKSKNQKTKTIIIVLTILLFLFLLINLLLGGANNENSEIINNDDQFVSEDQGLTAEEVINRMNEEEGVGIDQGPIELEIISPEGELFVLGQSRHYRAQILGLVNGSRCKCDWTFYLNEYDEEYLYQEMSDRPCTNNGNDTYVCGFTSTFIENLGELRVHVDVEVEKQGEIVQRAEADRMYIVQ